jgi:hypothetical protein
MPDGSFAVVIESKSFRKTATMFQMPGSTNKPQQSLSDTHASGNSLEILKDVEDDIARLCGFKGAPIYVMFEGRRLRLEELKLAIHNNYKVKLN